MGSGDELVIPYWLVLIANAGLMLMLAEGGFRFASRRDHAPLKEQLSGIQTAVLGLLALLLGFTFSMAVSRYEDRRKLVVKEANAIGTAYLRAGLLPEGHRQPVRDALRRYLSTRIRVREHALDPEQLAAGLKASEDLQNEIWRHGAEAAGEAPTAITATFINSANELIATGGERVAAARAQIPAGIWFMLIVVAGCGSLITGYRAGSDHVHSPFAIWFLPLLITFVIVLIFDLSHPLQGMIDISQRPLLHLQRSLAGP
jgi:hypothetical protein